jgi:leucyl/phenylalanyl-tRNA---protein transferase
MKKSGIPDCAGMTDNRRTMSRLDPRLLLQGYASGIFPMADSRDSSELFWVEPRNRAIIPLDNFHMSRSLRRTIRSGLFSATLDRDFAGVIAGCADREETWINADIERAMLALHASGHAHSIEVWAGGSLVGGVYGVKLGRAFFGESMFSRVTNASKVSLAWLVARLKVGGFTLLDCQFMTPHLESLGAVSVPRATYVSLLSGALGGGASGSPAGAGVVSATGSAAGASRSAGGTPEFLALERLLDATGAADDPGAAGYVIAQLLGQTS